MDKFLTLTFASSVTDVRQANYQFKLFRQKLERYLGRQFKYLGVIEFQKRGAVHYHVLFFDLKFKKGIRKEIAELWGKGFIKFKSAKKIEKIEHLGLYLAKYLQKEIMDKRLIGEKAYFTSQNLTKPLKYRHEETCEFYYSFFLPFNATIQKYQSKHYGTIKKITFKTHEN